MTAKEAYNQANKAIKQKEKEETKRRKELEKEKKSRINELIPKCIDEAYSKISKAISYGYFDTEYHIDGYYGEVMEKVKEALENDGYMVSQVHYDSGTSDMGDSAAPCVIDWKLTSIAISWNHLKGNKA